jgi:hypothetical protein
MNTLTALRSTLDEHAGAVTDAEVTVRLAAVHHRVSGVRRRRRAAGAGALGVVLLAGTAVALVPHLTSDAQPSAPVILGQKAPATMTSLGYTYRTDGHGASFDRSGSMDVPKSDEPRLFSWTTTSDATVTVRTPDRETWHSDVTAFHDFVVIPPGVSGRWRSPRITAVSGSRRTT